MDSKKILIIEDDQEIAALVAMRLKGAGYCVSVAVDGVSGLEWVRQNQPDLILLDLMLPGMSGTEICKNLRRNRETAEIPIIMMSACGDEIDRIVGFEIGADDYVVKPFSVRELLLRVQAVLRRNSIATNAPEQKIAKSSFVIDPDRYEVVVNNVSIPLTKMEFKLLSTLAEHPNVLLSRDDLINGVWGDSYHVNVRSIDTHIKRLRRKLGDAGHHIKTIHGFGYKLHLMEG